MPDDPTHSVSELEALAERLEESEDYRVLRRMKPRQRFHEDDGSKKLIGVVLDVETTGLDSAKDEIIELSLIPFEFTGDGRIFGVLDTFERLREPSIPIPAEITKLTGIDAEMVMGKQIDPDEVAAVAAAAVVVIAHHAQFDRRFVERVHPVFATKAWACSLTQIEWRREGFEGAKLGYLLAGYGLFHDGHRASDDCHALLEVLSRPLPMSGETALKRLLDSARKPTWQVWAENSPFDLKDKLKARGYRWNDGSDGRPKAWWTEVVDAQHDAEVSFLRKDIYGYDADILTRKVTAFDRFSDRV